jgi:hypothetical protein
MSKKDYELIARALHGHLTQYREDRQPDKANAIVSLAQRLASDLGDQTNRFDGLRFLRACGVEDR